jgi:hypothetical protein
MIEMKQRNNRITKAKQKRISRYKYLLIVNLVNFSMPL